MSVDTGRFRATTGSAVALGGLLLGVGALLCVAAHQASLLTVQRCVAPDRPLAWLGVHLALLREDAACPAGQLALGASPRHVAGLVVMVAVPTLLANLATVLGVIGVWVAIRALLAGAVDAVRRLWPSLPQASRRAAIRRAASLLPATERPLRAWQLDRSPVLRRGPPEPFAF